MYSGRTKEKEIDNGFIYPMVNKLITGLCFLNIVNLFKFIAGKIAYIRYKDSLEPTRQRAIRKSKNIAVDVFVVFKFFIILLLWELKVDNLMISLFVMYLIFMNTFTYFYHHVWEKAAILNQYPTVHRTRRRFINLTLSIAFMILAYGYLYGVPCYTNFKWGGMQPEYIKPLLFSISNSFNGGYNVVSPITEFGEMLKASQIVNIFVFVAIILARSIPQGDSKEKGEEENGLQK